MVPLPALFSQVPFTDAGTAVEWNCNTFLGETLPAAVTPCSGTEMLIVVKAIPLDLPVTSEIP